MLERLYRWVDERTGIDYLYNALFKRKIPQGVGWLYTLGFATLFVFALQAVTGAFLTVYYNPTPEHAYDSVRYIMEGVAFGSVVRGLHHWGGSAMVVLVALHGVVAFTLAAYKYPREFTWITGVLLLVMVLAFSFTGYLLPWDEKAYWATTVGINMAGTAPYIGGFLSAVLRGGAELGAVSLNRLYAIHIALLPAAASILAGIHMYLIFKHGVSVPPWLWDRERTGIGPLRWIRAWIRERKWIRKRKRNTTADTGSSRRGDIPSGPTSSSRT